MDNQQVDGRLRLILSAQVDTLDELEKIWMAGYAHGKHNESESKNPFPTTTVEHRYWAEGYESGTYGEAPLFPEYISTLSQTPDHAEATENRKRFHVNKVDKLIAGSSIGVATASMIAAALINFVA